MDDIGAKIKGSYHLERAITERKRAGAATCKQALEAHLKLAELHDHERAMTWYRTHVTAVKSRDVRRSVTDQIRSLLQALYRIN